MQYIFVVNNKAERSSLADRVEREASELDIRYSVYRTVGPGDAARYVNIYCDLNPKDEVCFVAVGGSGTINEVVSGIVNQPNKYLAILAWSGTCDFVKVYPERSFKSVRGIVEGTAVKVDIMKVNDNYSLNVINIGFDAMVACYSDIFSAENAENPYRRGLVRALLFDRYNKIKVVADGERMYRRKRILQATVSNGMYCGGEYFCAPRAVVDDGLMEVCSFRTMSLLTLLRIIPAYRSGRHLDDKLCRKLLKYKRARHVEVDSNDLIFICYDGEMIASSHFDIDIMEKSVNLILPAK